MISLDKKILDSNSAVARRMVEYGKTDELFIIIPDSRKIKLRLSSTVCMETSGGWCKAVQLLKLVGLGQRLMNENNIELISAQDPFFTGLAGLWLKKNNGVSLELQVHGDFFNGNYYRRGSLGNRILYFIARRIIYQADFLRTVGERVRKSLIMLGISEEKIIVRPVPIDAEKIKNYIPKINLKEKYSDFEKIFLSLGRLDKVKNISWLIDIFAEVVKKKPRYLLLIVGEGVDRENLKLQIKNLKLNENVMLEDWISEPLDYIKKANCVLFPSLSESYGLVAMESSIAGTPIIMNNVGVANYELQPGDNVKILPINDKEKWVEAILNS